MRTDLRCPACIIDDLRGALADCVADEALRQQILKQALEWLASALDYDRIPSYFITRVHRLLKERAGLVMPFAELRRRCNESGLRLAPVVQARAADTPDDLERFRLLVQWAIAGNHLDFRTVGTGYDLAPAAIEKALEEVLSEGLAIDDTPRILDLVRHGSSVLYLADNVGEIALDALLIAELQRHGCTATVAVKGGPITSDATIEDARAVGLDRIAPVILTGPDTLGIPIDEEMSPELRRALTRSDLVIGKGQANYYALSELAPTLPGRVACLLRTKCIPAATALGLSRPRANVAAILAQPTTPGPTGACCPTPDTSPPRACRSGETP